MFLEESSIIFDYNIKKLSETDVFIITAYRKQNS